MKRLDTHTYNMLREEIPLPREQLTQIHQEVMRRSRKDRRYRLLLILLAMAGPAATVLSRSALPTAWGVWAWRISAVITWLLLMLSALVFFQAMRPRYKHHLRRVLREDGYEVCTSCGYWLHELADDILRCPECGLKREAMVSKPMEERQ